MALPNQYAQVDWIFSDSNGVTWENVFWYELGGTFGSTYNIQTATAAVQTHAETEMLAVLASDSVFQGLNVRVNNNGVSGDGATFVTIPGTAAAGATPNEVAVVVHWQTASPGKSGRGRSYFAGQPVSFISGGRLTSGAITAYNTLAAKLLLSFTDQGITWGLRLYSRKLVSMIPTASYVTDLLVGTQRRRRPKR